MVSICPQIAVIESSYDVCAKLARIGDNLLPSFVAKFLVALDSPPKRGRDTTPKLCREAKDLLQNEVPELSKRTRKPVDKYSPVTEKEKSGNRPAPSSSKARKRLALPDDAESNSPSPAKSKPSSGKTKKKLIAAQNKKTPPAKKGVNKQPSTSESSSQSEESEKEHESKVSEIEEEEEEEESAPPLPSKPLKEDAPKRKKAAPLVEAGRVEDDRYEDMKTMVQRLSDSLKQSREEQQKLAEELARERALSRREQLLASSRPVPKAKGQEREKPISTTRVSTSSVQPAVALDSQPKKKSLQHEGKNVLPQQHMVSLSRDHLSPSFPRTANSQQATMLPAELYASAQEPVLPAVNFQQATMLPAGFHGSFHQPVQSAVNDWQSNPVSAQLPFQLSAPSTGNYASGYSRPHQELLSSPAFSDDVTRLNFVENLLQDAQRRATEARDHARENAQLRMVLGPRVFFR